ncbi:endonuclease V [Streptomyces sp. XM4193]|uniref:endonuclease V n=1 Tax=Streptomyces sp. XM4193 TaxID=2929782 RepID=UPI001FF9D8FF|nr:endonuclease V [Streptomyces sp. XM4193]MCK1797288.1 endonuclease V [Streptomyces sp. XM4193]
MRTTDEHRTPADDEEAVATQLRLRGRVDLVDSSPAPGAPGTLVAGVDVAYDDAGGRLAAAAVLLDAAELRVVHSATARGPVPYPYRPGLLAFRELPAVLEALSRLDARPDLVVCDGYGLAHPRRFGLASHLGVVTAMPCLGVAKNPFGFHHGELGAERGARAPLLDPETGEEVGAALRTRRGVKPVYVSAGHRVSADAACAHVLSLAREYRQPETTRLADRLCRDALAAPG